MGAWNVDKFTILLKQDEVTELNSQSVPRLFAYVFSLYLVFIPLLWGWIRCALSLMEGMRKKHLRHGNLWIRILKTVPAFTMGILAGVFFSSVACLCECIHSHWLLAFAIGGFGFLSFVVGWTIWRILRSINAELGTISDISGT